MTAFFIVLAIGLTMITIAGVVVAYFINKNKHEFSFTTVFSIYFYLVAMISLLAVFFGSASISKALLSDLMGRDFSYYSYSVDVQPEEWRVGPNGDDLSDEELQAQQEKQMLQEKERVEELYRDDLFTGISTLIVGALFLFVHVLGWRRLEPAKNRSQSFYYRGYIILQLALYSVITLAALPMAIAQTLRFVMWKSTENGSLTPGEPLSIALWSTPLWLFFIWVTFRVMRREGQKST